MFGNLFKSKKEKDIEQLGLDLVNGVISRESYLEHLYAIDRDIWFTKLNSNEKQSFELTGKYNRNEITKDEYKEQIKNIDIDKWLSVASADEKQIHQLESDLKSKKITENEFDKEVATINKEPFITFSDVKFDVGEQGRHELSLDWNEYFIEELKKMGYTGPSEEDIVDQWFVAFCTTIAAESDAVIVSDPEDLRKVRYDKDNKKTEYF